MAHFEYSPCHTTPSSTELKMGLRTFGTLFYAYACACLFVFILRAAYSQRSPGTRREPNQRAALRQTLQWSHNGKIFSILSHGSEYETPRRRGAPQEQVQARPVTVIRDAQKQQQPVAQQRSSSAAAAASDPPGLPPPLQRLVRGREQQHRDRDRPGERAGTQRSNSVNETQARVTVRPPLPRRDDMMVGDDPYDPYKSIDSDNPYYNYYDVYERPSPRSRPGYGTRYHQYGKKSIFKATTETERAEMLAKPPRNYCMCNYLPSHERV